MAESELNQARAAAAARAAHDFFDTVGQQRAKVRSDWKQKAGRLLDAHLLGVSASLGMINRFAGRPAKTDATTSNTFALTAAFVQGIDLCEIAIAEGYYLQAAALLKQEMETIAALHELKKGNRKEGKTPNVSHVPAGMAKLYGQLNDCAHVGLVGEINNVLSKKLSDEVTGSMIIPTFNEGMAFRYYGMHVTFILQNALQIDELLSELYGSGKNDVEEQMIESAFRILVEAGWLEIDKQKQGISMER